VAPQSMHTIIPLGPAGRSRREWAAGHFLADPAIPTLAAAVVVGTRVGSRDKCHDTFGVAAVEARPHPRRKLLSGRPRLDASCSLLGPGSSCTARLQRAWVHGDPANWSERGQWLELSAVGADGSSGVAACELNLCGALSFRPAARKSRQSRRVRIWRSSAPRWPHLHQVHHSRMGSAHRIGNRHRGGTRPVLPTPVRRWPRQSCVVQPDNRRQQNAYAPLPARGLAVC